MAKRSRRDRWNAALETIRQGVSELQELVDESQEWRDGIPENLEDSPVAEKLDAVISDGEQWVSDVETVVDDAEGADLPLGFGRD